jgi:uncharacterized protein YcfJ
MVRKLLLGTALLASATTAMVPSAASAQRYYNRYEQVRGGDDWRYEQRPRYVCEDDRRWNDRRYRDERGYERRAQGCSRGTTSALVGALAGGLLGRTIDSRGDRTLGTILGGGAGALAGHAIEKSNNAGYCR